MDFDATYGNKSFFSVQLKSTKTELKNARLRGKSCLTSDADGMQSCDSSFLLCSPLRSVFTLLFGYKLVSRLLWAIGHTVRPPAPNSLAEPKVYKPYCSTHWGGGGLSRGQRVSHFHCVIREKRRYGKARTKTTKRLLVHWNTVHRG